MSPAKKAVAKVPPKGRFTSFDSASAEWKGDPVVFQLDGAKWDCMSVPTAEVLDMIANDDGVTMMQFIRACIKDKEGWDARILDEENPVTLPLIEAIYRFLLVSYFGEDVLGKS